MSPTGACDSGEVVSFADIFVRISENDIKSDYLEAKLVGKAGEVDVVKINSGGDEQLQIKFADDVLTGAKERYIIITTTTNGQTSFILPNTPLGTLRMYPQNGPELFESIDFTYVGNAVTYIASVPSFSIGDRILFKYFAI